MTCLGIISDTHGKHDYVRVPPCDILIHAGDCAEGTGPDGLVELQRFLTWLERQPAPHKVLIAGNHDWVFERYEKEARAMVVEVAPSVTYLQDSEVNIGGLTIWGSPVSPRFYDWAFNRDRGAAIRAHWDLIPDNVDILVTHGPAKGYLDWTDFGKEHCGCKDLYEAILRVQPRLHVAGHVHGGYGTKELVHDNGSKTIMVNASICDEAYRPVHAPWMLHL